MNGSITRLAVQALGWSYAFAGIRIAVQAAGGILLAQMLGPRPFGLIAAAWAIAGIANQFVDLGFSAALIQKPEITDRDVRFMFTVQMAAGSCLAALVALLAPVAAGLLNEPGLTEPVRWLCPVLVAQAAGQTSHALLRRKLDLKTVQIAQTAGVAAGYVLVALPLAAFTGFGVLSLACGILAQMTVSSAVAYAAVRHPLVPAWRGDGALMSFGLRVTATNLVNWLSASLDSLVMSRCFGANALGLYNRAQNLAVTPASTLVGVAQGVLFPAYSRRAADASASQRAFLASVGATLLVVLPAFTVLAVAPRPIIVGLLGESWLPAAPLLAALAFAMPWQAVAALCGPLLWAKGQVRQELRIQVAVLMFYAVLLGFAAGRSPLAVAVSFVAANVLRAAAMWVSVGMPAGDSIRLLRAPLALSAIVGACALAAARLSGGSLAAIAAAAGAGLGCGGVLLRDTVGFDWRLYRAASPASAGGSG